MKILITGSNGMLGSDLCEILDGAHEVAGLDIVRHRPPAVRHQAFHETNVNDPKRIREIIDKEAPELVIHAAAWTDVDGCERDPEKAFAVNTNGTNNIVNALCDRDVPLIFISTDFVFDGEKGEPYTESDRANPLSVYGRSKWEAEEAIRRTLPRHAILRSGWLYGLNGNNFVNTVITKAKEEGRLKVVSDQMGSPTYTRDLAVAIKKLVSSVGVPDGETYHVSSAGWCSWYEFAVSILEKVPGLEDVRVEAITSEELDRPARRPRYSVLDRSRFEMRTGHKMRAWQEALEEYLGEYARVA